MSGLSSSILLLIFLVFDFYDIWSFLSLEFLKIWLFPLVSLSFWLHNKADLFSFDLLLKLT